MEIHRHGGIYEFRCQSSLILLASSRTSKGGCKDSKKSKVLKKTKDKAYLLSLHRSIHSNLLNVIYSVEETESERNLDLTNLYITKSLV